MRELEHRRFIDDTTIGERRDTAAAEHTTIGEDPRRGCLQRSVDGKPQQLVGNVTQHAGKDLFQRLIQPLGAIDQAVNAGLQGAYEALFKGAADTLVKVF